MDVATDTGFEDHYVDAAGHRIRYLEKGSGHPVLLLHGGSLGSSADVFRRNLGPLADAGLRAIAPDMPGFGLSEYSEDSSFELKEKVILGLMDALGLDKAALVGHSQAGGTAVRLALGHPDRFTHVMILGTGSLLPPLESGAGQRGEAAIKRMDSRMAQQEPTIDDTRKLLEATLFHHELITEEELALRHSRSVGDNFKAHVARAAANANRPKGGGGGGKPLWERLDDLTQPLLMIYGREDRARAYDRAMRLKELRPGIDLHIVDGCKHLVPWDAADTVAELGIPFLKS